MAQPAIIVEPVLKLYWGVPYGDTITFYQSDGETPVDLTGLKISASLHRGTPESPGAVAFAITTDNGYITNAAPSTGVITFAMTGAIVATIPAVDYVMTVFITNSGGTVIANGHPLIRYVQVFPSGVTPGT